MPTPPTSPAAQSSVAQSPPGRRRLPRGEGLAMSLSSVLGSLAGLVGWIVAARLMPQAEVGRASAFVSGFILVAGAAQLHVGVALLRWLPPSGSRAGVLLRRTFLVVGSLALVAGLIYGVLAPELGETAAAAVGATLPVGIVVFAVAALAWVVFTVQDYVLVGLGLAWWSTIRNAVFAVVRIGLLVALALGGAGAGGLVLSWIGPLLAWVVVTGALIVVVVARRRTLQENDNGVLPSRTEVVGFIGPTATAQIGVVLLFNQVPLLVTLRWGPDAGAAFFVAWQAIIVVDTAAVFFTNALSAQVAREPDRTDELCAAAGRKMLVLFLPALAVGALLAGPALSIFGPGYAEATPVLQLLLLGLAFRLVVLNELAALQAVGRAIAYSVLQMVSTVLVLVPVAVLPVGSVADVPGSLLPLALGYVVVQVVCAVGVLVLPRLGRRSRRPSDGRVAPTVEG